MPQIAEMKQLGKLDLNACDGFTPGVTKMLKKALSQCEIKWPSRSVKRRR